MLVCEAGLVEVSLELIVEDFFKQVLELAVVCLEDGVLRAHVHGVVAGESVTERSTCEVADAVIEVVHTHCNATVRAVVSDGEFHWLAAIFGLECHCDGAFTRNLEVGCLVLVTMCVTTDHDGLCPTWNKLWNVVADNWLTEHNTTEDVADCAVRRLPHLLQTELFNTSLVGGNRRALDTNAMLQDRLRRIDGDLVISRVAVLHAEVVVLKFDVEVRENEALFNELPDDASHLVAVEFNDWIVNLDLRHGGTLSIAQQAPKMGRQESLVFDLYTIAQGASTPPTISTDMDFVWTPEQIELRREAAEFAAEGVRKYGRHNVTWMNGYSKEFSKELSAKGYLGMIWPKEFGGGGRPAIDRLIVGEEMIKAGAPIAASWFGDRQMGPALIQYGTKEQQEQFLPGILAGETTWCIGMSEPNSGSDLASLKTSAVDDGDEWIINGQKIWTSFGADADYCYLICRTNNEGPPHAGISEIIVPMKTPGIEIRRITDMTTNRHFCEVFFTDVRVPKGNLVGQPGGAFGQTMRQLEHERGGIDRLVSNYAQFQHAISVCDTSDPLIRQEIASLEMGYRIGRILVIREVLKQAPAGFSAATKCFCTEHQQRVDSFVFRMMGADGMIFDDMVQGLIYGPGYTIMGGTSNVMRNILGERVLGLAKG
ncbi:MAG: hypothetical protein RL114_438 [Actinomycetota bacterium]